MANYKLATIVICMSLFAGAVAIECYSCLDLDTSAMSSDQTATLDSIMAAMNYSTCDSADSANSTNCTEEYDSCMAVAITSLFGTNDTTYEGSIRGCTVTDEDSCTGMETIVGNFNVTLDSCEAAVCAEDLCNSAMSLSTQFGLLFLMVSYMMFFH